MSKSELAATVLGSRIARRIAPRSHNDSRALRILAYHRVLDDDLFWFPFDEGLISATSRSFARQMEFARRHFDVISFRDLDACERAGKPWPRRALIVTFDDGYGDNYTHAFPILKRLGLPATIFLATSHIGGARLFWWDLLAYCLKRTPLPALHFADFPDIAPQPMPLSNARARRAAFQAILRWAKRAPEATKNRFLERLPVALQVALPADVADGAHLSWQQVQEMAASGIEFGGHSATHPILTNISAARLEEEIRMSKRTIERHLGDEAVAFAYPEGRKSYYNQAVQQAVERAGFRYAVSYEEGAAFEDGDRYALPRIHVEVDQTAQVFRANLMFPALMLREGDRT